MYRHECVINLEKMIRFSKLFNNYYYMGLPEAFCEKEVDDDLYEYVSWLKEIEGYITKSAKDSMEKRILEVQEPNEMLAFVEDDTKDIDIDIRMNMQAFAKAFIKLKQVCDKRHEKSKGIYKNLPDALANDKAVSLLYRAIQAGYLDYQFMPTPGTDTQQLRIIGYAVAKIMGFKKREFWPPFNWLWYNQNKGKLACAHLSKFILTRFKALTDLYPEVDFMEMLDPNNKQRLVTQKSDAQLKELYRDLKAAGYIASKTTTSQFLGIFGRTPFQDRVEWTREQRSLSYFIYLAFHDTTRHCWDAARCCFTIDGDLPNRDSLSSGFASIKKEGKITNYDVDILRIVDKFARN